jgi:hypothetical protein
MTNKHIGLHTPTILLPAPQVDMTRWAVVACDQYTSQPDYWKEVKAFVGDSPSSLNLIFPEVYLGTANEEVIRDSIYKMMRQYLSKKVLVPQKPGFVLVNRTTTHTASRKGLVIALDLEKYDYAQNSQSLIRATEDTILSRIYPRKRIREKASLELPHVMVLIDDPEKTVIEPLFEKPGSMLYDCDLMMNGGHITGYSIADTKRFAQVGSALERLADPGVFERRYGVSGKGILLYAMGDGNHSFATAKAIWESLKQNTTEPACLGNHPARYSLVELVNLHDEGLHFEPIHRVVFHSDVDDVLRALGHYFQTSGSSYAIKTCVTPQELGKLYQTILTTTPLDQSKRYFRFVSAKKCGVTIMDTGAGDLEVDTLQLFLDQYLKNNIGSEIDYIHGNEALISLATRPETIGFILPSIQKQALFKTVLKRGVLPRKAFSMGDADEKRFYLEARKIVP